jgi:hypothetical protein
LLAFEAWRAWLAAAAELIVVLSVDAYAIAYRVGVSWGQIYLYASIGFNALETRCIADHGRARLADA